MSRDHHDVAGQGSCGEERGARFFGMWAQVHLVIA